MSIGKILFALVVMNLKSYGQTWDIDYAHSSVNFSIQHFFTPVKGRFQRFTGQIVFNPAHPNDSRIEFTVDVASVNTDDAKRDKDIHSPNFFDSKQFPKMKFVSNRIEKLSENQYMAYGRLFIRDVSKDVEIPFLVLGCGDHPIKKGSQILAVRSEFKISRNEYGVGSGTWVETVIVGGDVTVDVVLEAITKK